MNQSLDAKTLEEIASERFWRERGRSANYPGLFDILNQAPAQLDACERLLIYTLVRTISPEVAVEVGTFQGGSASIIHTALESAGRGKLFCIDPKPQLRIDWNKLSNRATMIEEPSPQAYAALATLIPSPVEFAFIDGVHRYENVIADTMGILPYLAGSAWLLYHDAFNHGVRAGIDHLVSSVPQLSEAGTVCRYFNNTQWPTTVMCGLRMLYFHDPDRAHWLPPGYAHPCPLGAPSKVTSETRDRFRQQVLGLIEQKQTPIGVYGLTPLLAALTPELASVGAHVAAVIEDDPLLHGNERLGWPILHPAEALGRGIKSILVLARPGDVHPSRMNAMSESGLRVVLVEAKDDERNSAEDSFSSTPDLAEVVKALAHELDITGVRRVVLAGADENTARLGPWLASHQTNFLLLGVVDPERSRHGQSWWGAPVVPIDRLSQLRLPPEIVVPTSAETQRWLREHEGTLSASRIRLLTPFN